MYYRIKARKWFQRSYGNTYHSVRVTKCSGEGENYKEEQIGYAPFVYGYGDHYLNTAALILDMSEADLRQDIREHREKYAIFAQDVSRKKDL